MRRTTLSLREIMVLSALLVGMSGFVKVWAQPVPAGEGLEEIVVTAEKRQEDVQKTAIAITTISGEEIAKRAESELDTALRNVPSLQVQSTPQGGEIYIRGVGANGDSNFVDPSIALHFDGVYSGRSERLSAGLYDIHHIEVLRGPQGTIYGRNADGGAVNIISNGPVIGSSEIQAHVQLGDYSLKHVDGAINIPVNDQLAFRVAAERERRNGYFTNDGYSSDVSAMRVKGLYKPTESLSIQALYDYAHEGGHWATTVPAPAPFAGPPGAINIPGVGVIHIFDSTTDFCAGPNGGWLNTQPNNAWYVDPCHPADSINYTFETLALQADYAASWGKVTLIPTYSHSTRYVLTNLVVGDDPFFGGSLNSGVGIEHQKTVEVRIASPDSSAIKWVIGYYYLWSDNLGTVGGATTGQVSVAGVPTNVDIFDTFNEGASPTVSSAPFGQITYPVTDTLRVTGGLRYTKDTKSQAVRIVSNYIAGYDSGTTTANVAYSATTYKAGVEYDVAPQSMAYAQVTTGYKAGGFDTTATPPKAYGPEKVTAYELGIKTRFLDNQLQVNADVYYYDYKDLQVQYHVSPDPLFPIPSAYLPAPAGPPIANPCPNGNNFANNCFGNFQQYIANAGAGKNKGIEIESRYRVTPYDELDVNATYANAHYGTFADPTLASLSGETIAMTPTDTVVVNYEHDWVLGDARLEAQVDSKWSSSYYSSIANRSTSTYGFQKAYTRSDASLTYNAGKWSVGAWAKNIEDKAQLQFGDFPLNRSVINFPRTFGVSMGVRL